MWQVDELGNGGCLVVDLLLEELLPGGTCSHTGSQHPEAVGADVLQSVHLALGRVEADGRLPLIEETASAAVPMQAEDVDVIEVGQDEWVWTKGGGQVSEQ